ncbi:unnamed protein product, partial [Thlaspi arvense]
DWRFHAVSVVVMGGSLLSMGIPDNSLQDLIQKVDSDCGQFVDMDKLLEFGRRAMFYVRVLSGYEERRIRSYRLQLQRRLQEVLSPSASLLTFRI